TTGTIENHQFHRVTEMLSRNALKNNDVYQAIAYKKREFNPIDLFKIEGWTGTLSMFFNFSGITTQHTFSEIYERAQKIDAPMSRLMKQVTDMSYDFFSQEFGVLNSILLSNGKKHVAQIQAVTGILFEENYLTGVASLKNTLLRRRDPMFDMFMSAEDASAFFQSCKKKIEQKKIRDDGSKVLPDFCGKDVAGMFMYYSLGSNVNPHLAIFAKTGAGKSSALLKILQSSMMVDPATYIAKGIVENEVKVRYIDIDHSSGTFMERLRKNHRDDMQIYGSKISKMKFCLLDLDLIEDFPNAKASPEDIKGVCAFVNVILETTDDKGGLSNAEEERFKDSIEKVFAEDKHRVDKTIYELGMEDGYEEMVEKIMADYPKETKLSELKGEWSFLNKPTLINVIDYVHSRASSNSIDEVQKRTYQSLESKISGLSIFNFAKHANQDISVDKAIYHIDLGEVSKMQKDFIAIGWMLLRKWFKIDRDTYLERISKGLPRQKIFYIIEESHNFFTVPSFKVLFQAAVKECRKFGVHFIFVSHTPDDIPLDIYSALSTKLFLFTKGDADLVKNSIEKKARMTEGCLEIYNQAKKENHSLFIMHDGGQSLCKLDMTKDDLATFAPKELLPY
ncbi:MAG: hypothetical protein PF437_09305, partial [Sulfurimonas sp.]|nr:hypothetical protein [Sulfurimonas sp.]